MPFTIPTPIELPVAERGGHWWIEAAGRPVRLSNLTKVFWRGAGYTKGDLLAYYWNVAPVLLPYLRDRPLTLFRRPDGAAGPSWIEKHVPSYTPDWVPRCHIPNFLGGGEFNDFAMANDEAVLMFLANLGCIEMHPLHARCDAPSVPDYLFFDLDPSPPASFEDVRAVALHVRAALESLGLPAYPKTTGGTGLHVFVPAVRNTTFRAVREFVAVIARAIRDVDPARVTLEWDVPARAGKVFIDANMNRRGQNIAAAYSLRPTDQATVSAPVSWDEVEQGFEPADFTIGTIHDRLAAVGDPFAGVIESPVDVRPAMSRLGVRGDEE